MLAQENDLQLRRREKGDIERLFQLGNHKEIARNLSDGFPSPYTKEAAIERVENNNAAPSTHFAVAHEGKLAGGAGFDRGEGDCAHIAHIGYWLGLDYHGKGYGTRLVKLLSTYIFEQYEHIHRQEAFTFPLNIPSMRVLEKNGFQAEGVLKKGREKNNKYVDVHLYAIVR